MGGRALTIRTDLPAAELRRLARREEDRAAAARMQAIAGALEGLSRAEAARLAGMERQALRDAVVRYNAEGLTGLHDRPRPDRPARLDARGLCPSCAARSNSAGVCRTTPRTWAS
jgi:hypothetical protein